MTDTPTRADLKPCPFCGCVMQITEDRHGYFGPDGDHVKGCILSVDMHDYAGCHKDLLIRDWNTRAPTAYAERIAALETLRKAALALRDDLLERAERDAWKHDGDVVVEAGAGVWRRFNEALGGC